MTNHLPIWKMLPILAFSACATVGPKYERPPVDTPAEFRLAAGWKAAEPRDAAARGKWWESFNDPELSSLEEGLDASNQNVAAAYAGYVQAQALVKQARSGYFPTVSIAPNASAQGGGAVSSGFAAATAGPFSQYSVPVQASWIPDLWGRVRSSVEERVASAQLSAADLANVRLGQRALLATYYFELRSQDELRELLASTVKAFRESLRLTQSRAKNGLESDEAVAQAETQLRSAEAQATNLEIARAQYVHAIAVLSGRPAPTFSISERASTARTVPPAVPVGVPSQLLERRPDVASAERAMAAANAQIGFAKAAYFPQLTLNGGVGFGSNSIRGLLDAPTTVWSLGVNLAETIFDSGLRAATVEQARAVFDQNVARYRQAVLVAFQQVEDALATAKTLELQVAQQEAAVHASERYLRIANQRYSLGIDPYLNVISAQVSLLSGQQTAVRLRMQRNLAAVQLVEALGGGWDASHLSDPPTAPGKVD